MHLAAILKGKPFQPISPASLPDPRDRALANRIVTTAMRRHGHISLVLDDLLKKGVPDRAGPLEAVLRTGIAQLLYMEGIPAHSALHLSVEAARRDKRSGRFDKLVNGVLRQAQRDAEKFAALDPILLLPDWLAKGWIKTFGAEAVNKFCVALLEGAPLDLTLKRYDKDLVDALGGELVIGNSIRVNMRESVIADLPGFAEGKWWVQDAAATLGARLINAGKGMRVLDLCAAPGGKTAQLASMGADVVALDIDENRLERLAQNMDRLGFAPEVVVADALAYEPDEKFDAVLLDAPCSATGTFRRHPEVLWQRDAGGIAERVRIQRAMVSHALDLLKPGGLLVYCVCSLESEEGEDQARWALEQFKSIALAPVSADELDGWGEPITSQGTVRTHPGLAVPGSAGGTLDGFFIARFVKN